MVRHPPPALPPVLDLSSASPRSQPWQFLSPSPTPATWPRPLPPSLLRLELRTDSPHRSLPPDRATTFHQFDVYGNLLGLLAAHPVAPLVFLHHLNVVEHVFPDAPFRAAGLRRIFDGPVRLDSAAVFQQSICYEASHLWTLSVSWGFALQLVRGVMFPREIEMPARTFLN